MLASKSAVVYLSLFIPLFLLTFFSAGCGDAPALSPEELGEVIDEPALIPGIEEHYEFPSIEELAGSTSEEAPAEDGSSDPSNENDDEGAEAAISTDSNDTPIFDLLDPVAEDEEPIEELDPTETE